MDNLEDLTNDQLRLRLLEFGFSNMPVTSTTRNVLIKKLRNTVDKEKSKNRRETIHVTKYSSGEESEIEPKKAAATKKINNTATNRRATIAIPQQQQPAKPNIVPIVEAQPQPPIDTGKITNRRRSGRRTPLENENERNEKKKLPVPTVANIIEDSDDDDILFVPISPRKKSRSPSLAKSDTVVTSYKHVTASISVPSQVPEELDSSTDAEVRNFIVVSDDEIQQKKSVPPPLLPTKNASRKSEYIPTVSEFVSPRLNTRSSISTSYNLSYKPPVNGNDSYASSRRYTSFTPKLSAPIVGVEEQDDDDAVETPYLTDFARRLTSLKAEPLVTGSPRPLSNTVNYYRTSERIHGRLSTDTKLSKGGAFRQYINNFEQKNRWVIWPLFVLICAIFVYVFFFTN